MEAVELELLVDSDGDTSRIDELTRQLLTEIRSLNTESLALRSSPMHPGSGAKSGDAITVGAIAIALAPVVLTELIALLKEWCGRREDRSIKILYKNRGKTFEVEVTSGRLPAEELGRLMQLIENDSTK